MERSTLGLPMIQAICLDLDGVILNKNVLFNGIRETLEKIAEWCTLQPASLILASSNQSAFELAKDFKITNLFDHIVVCQGVRKSIWIYQQLKLDDSTYVMFDDTPEVIYGMSWGYLVQNTKKERGLKGAWEKFLVDYNTPKTKSRSLSQ